MTEQQDPYEELKAWEEEQAYLASESAKAVADLEAEEDVFDDQPRTNK